MSEEWPSIPEFYAGRTILITGATGFMGKVLVEKLLRSCPDLTAIYLLLRTRKGAAPDARLRDLIAQPLFDRLRETDAQVFGKLRAVAGDLKAIGLGLRSEDRITLQTEVSLVFHAAASVRFDDPLRAALLVNVRGTRELLRLALGMRRLRALLHLSTAFSNCDRPVVQETLYPAPADWAAMIRVAEGDICDEVLECFTPKVKGSLPNTYTFAKALAEHVVNDFRSQLPVIIVRPSIVVAASEEPYPGWLDNLNGPSGLWMGGFTGVMSIAYVNGDSELDTVPVDVAIRSLIGIAWQRALDTDHSATRDAVPYNCCSMVAPVSQREFIAEGKLLARELPTLRSAWYPTMQGTNSWTYFMVNMLLFHLLPGYCMDWALERAGRKPMFVRLYRRVVVASRALALFSTRSYRFTNQRFLAVAACIKPIDRSEFGFAEVVRDDHSSALRRLEGLRHYLLNDPISTLSAAKIRHRRLYWLDRGVKFGFWLLVACAIAANSAARTAVCAFVGPFVSAIVARPTLW